MDDCQDSLLVTVRDYREKIRNGHIVVVFDMDEVLLTCNPDTDTIEFSKTWYNILSFLNSRGITTILWTMGERDYMVDMLYSTSLFGYFKTMYSKESSVLNVLESNKSGALIRYHYPQSFIVLIDDTPSNGDEDYDLIINHKSITSTWVQLNKFIHDVQKNNCSL